MNRKAGLLLICFLLAVPVSRGQLPVPDKPLFSEYIPENSNIPSNTIYNIFCGKDGYLWLISDVGLIKFDGNSFEEVVRGDVINAYKTNKDMLILIFFSGATRGLNLVTHKIVNTDSLWGIRESRNKRPFFIVYETNNNLTLIKNEYLVGDTQYSAVTIINNRAHYVTDKSIIAKLLKSMMGDTAVSYHLEKMKSPYFFRAAQNSLVINGIIYLKDQANGLSKVLFDGTARQDEITSYLCIGDDLWVGTLNNGLTIYRNFNSPKQKKITLLPNSISGIVQDNYENIWVSTLGNGLMKFRPEEMAVKHYSSKDLGIDNNSIKLLNKVGHDTIAFTCNTGKSVQIWSKKGRIYKHHFDNAIDYVFKQGYELYFLGKEIYTLDSRNIKKNSRPGKKNDKLYGNNWKDLIFQGKDICALTTTNYFKFGPDGVYGVDSYEHITNKTTFQKPDPANTITGTTKGIYYNERKLKWLENAHFLKIRIVGEQLLCCTMDGIYRINLKMLSDASALVKVSNDIAQDIRADAGVIFLNTKKSILTLDTQNYAVRTFSFKHFTVPFSVTNFFIDTTCVVISGNKGVFYFPKEYFQPRKNIPPPIHLLNSLQSNLPSDSLYQCSFQKKLVALFKVDILDYNTAIKTIKYRVLKDGEVFYEWSGINENSVVRLNRPLPGHYRIEYSISCDEKNWSKNVSYTFIVTPLWWQTPLAQFFKWVFVIAAIAVVISYVLRLRYRKSTEKINEMLYRKELESEALFAQMKPHFIFNALIPFQDLTIKGDTHGALDYVNTFSRLIRGILKSSRSKVVTINEEMNFIGNYIKIQQHLLKNSFSVEVTIDASIDVDEVVIPSMLLQPIVENAIEHGVSKVSEGKISIHIFSKSGETIISVYDNGKGFAEVPGEKSSDALDIIKERLLLIKKASGTGSLKISDNLPQNGTTVTLVLPYKRKQNTY